MIDTLGVFIKRNLRSHARRILQTSHPYLSAIISVLIVFYTMLDLRPMRLSAVFLPYDTVVFGFTATAIALAIAIPSERFVTFLSSIKDGSTPFKDFLFVLAWNGLVHIVAFLLFIPFIFLPPDWVLMPGQDLSFSRLYVTLLLWVQFYACFQFLVTTLSVYELADLYGNYCARERRRTDSAKH